MSAFVPNGAIHAGGPRKPRCKVAKPSRVRLFSVAHICASSWNAAIPERMCGRPLYSTHPWRVVSAELVEKLLAHVGSNTHSLWSVGDEEVIWHGDAVWAGALNAMRPPSCRENTRGGSDEEGWRDASGI